MKKIDLIIPCHNEEDNIERFFAAASETENSIEDCCFRYIFVDDGSTDGTLDKIKALEGAGYISFSRNFGKEAAMYAGLKASAKGDADYAVVIDADLQHPPELIKEMLKKLEETGCDSVAARRVSRKGEPVIRSIFARLFYKIMNRFSEIHLADGVVDFRIMSHRMVKTIADMPERCRFSKGLFQWVGFDTQWIEFENVKRVSGESRWTVWGLTKYAIDGFVDFADSPLKAAGVAGSVIAVGSLLYLIAEIIKTILMGKDTPGYASTICLILFFGGVIIAMLGIIGEYIGRMYIETKARPVYVEKESNIENHK
ncbi:MAG: glycosyltransferase family 2 protein [Firmicutes bacterium]|nr:glycosyltransferase family 2 protein [Bacillota bacterium]